MPGMEVKDYPTAIIGIVGNSRMQVKEPPANPDSECLPSGRYSSPSKSGQVRFRGEWYALDNAP